jgi:cobalamin biosynthetic protein CobC
MTNRSDLPSPRHGGDLAYATATFGNPDGGWLDLSTGVNPNPYPVRSFDVTALARLPSPDGMLRLLAAAGAAYGAPPTAAIAATPGTEIAIRLLPAIAPPGPVAIVWPTYGSHADAWRRGGRTPRALASLDDVPTDTAVVVVGNPNNPDGRTTPPGTLERLALRLGARNGLLIVDEAFADVTPEVSLASRVGPLPIVVLRSFGKFFGLPGLRLGFVVGAPVVVAKLAALLGDWPVSAPAMTVGTAALSDHAWQTAARTELAGKMRRLRALLAGHNLAIHGGTDLFALIGDAEAAALHRRLAERGIWTRAFADQPTWLRVGLPGNDADFDRLDGALKPD